MEKQPRASNYLGQGSPSKGEHFWYHVKDFHQNLKYEETITEIIQGFMILYHNKPDLNP